MRIEYKQVDKLKDEYDPLAIYACRVTFLSGNTAIYTLHNNTSTNVAVFNCISNSEGILVNSRQINNKDFAPLFLAAEEAGRHFDKYFEGIQKFTSIKEFCAWVSQ